MRLFISFAVVILLLASLGAADLSPVPEAIAATLIGHIFSKYYMVWV